MVRHLNSASDGAFLCRHLTPTAGGRAENDVGGTWTGRDDRGGAIQTVLFITALPPRRRHGRRQWRCAADAPATARRRGRGRVIAYRLLLSAFSGRMRCDYSLAPFIYAVTSRRHLTFYGGGRAIPSTRRRYASSRMTSDGVVVDGGGSGVFSSLYSINLS